MPKTVLHLFHADPAAIQAVPALADRIRSTPDATLDVHIFGPTERMLANPDQTDFNARIDALVICAIALGSSQPIKGAPSRRAPGL